MQNKIDKANKDLLAKYNGQIVLKLERGGIVIVGPGGKTSAVLYGQAGVYALSEAGLAFAFKEADLWGDEIVGVQPTDDQVFDLDAAYSDGFEAGMFRHPAVLPHEDAAKEAYIRGYSDGRRTPSAKVYTPPK